MNGRYGLRFVLVAAGLALVALARPAYPAESIPELLRQAYWGEGSEDLARQFGAAAIKLPRGFDFGDSNSGPCGLTGQLLVRLSPADGIAAPDPYALALRRSRHLGSH